ncbi:MAG: bifunctional phosphopantothenoylcysteine decarboxylase/phosphopantothenate--cysteine ligase CoaBC [Lachnospiraceae bacterium]|nr:bifunctional phosphopantothenoylcysteine decarboxylase/phosphopantothenate--cysteine ligase CoaBC [Lachnospiraceae bacterium]
MLKGKTIVLGVTGSIAAYKIADLASALIKLHADVQVIMTANATNFINPITFETLTGNKCLVDTFDRNFNYSVEHVALAKRADVFMIAPATANVIGKLAHGIADDMLTTTALACGGRGNNTGDFCSMIVAPAMNTNMYCNTVVRNNLAMLKELGYEICEPDTGRLACGDTGKGKLPPVDELLAYILKACSHKKDLEGKKVLITAGATMEAIDPVRFITNHSTGRMGVALSEAAIRRGAKVTLVAGHMEVLPPYFVDVVKVASAEEMYEEVTKRQAETDIIIKAAAVADYTPIEVASEKVKKSDGDMSIALKRTKDILGYLGEHKKDGQVIVGFSMETENMLENSKKKLAKKNADMIVANNLKTEGAGFGVDTNVVTIITQDDVKELPKMSKAEVADAIFDALIEF